MIYRLFLPLKDQFILFNLLRYITFRVAMGAITAMLLSFIFGWFLIPRLKRWKLGEHISGDLPERHKNKEGTPTMGGLILIFSVILSTLLWADPVNLYIILAIVATLWMGIIGFLDDYIKFKGKSDGLLAKHKFLGQAILGLGVGIVIYLFAPTPALRSSTELPFIKNVLWNMGIFYIAFVAIVLSGASNAINLTDGLDGLAAGLSAVVAAVFVVIAYITGRADFSTYLQIVYLPGSGELSIFCAAIGGALLGFLWFNCNPAEIFLGDTGALALGSALGIVSVMLKKEFTLLIVGGVFVMETFSVILQVSYFRISGGKRIFRMAPLHHHFEMLGWQEPKIVVRFWIIGIIFGLLGLATLKVR